MASDKIEVETEQEFQFNKLYTCSAELDGSGAFFAFNKDMYPKNREHLLDHCIEHAGNTCCQMKHID